LDHLEDNLRRLQMVYLEN